MKKIKVMSWICYIVFLISAVNVIYQLIFTGNINVIKIYAFIFAIGLIVVTTINVISIINR